MSKTNQNINKTFAPKENDQPLMGSHDANIPSTDKFLKRSENLSNRFDSDIKRNLSNRISSKENTIKGMKSDIDKKDAIIKRLKSLIVEKDTTIEKLSTTIVSKDTTIEEMKTSLDEAAKDRSLLNSVIVDQAKVIYGLRNN